MADLRIQMPDGEMFRTASKRRYVVAVKGPSATATWRAEYRTDVESRAVASWRHEARIAEHAALVDTIDRVILQVKAKARTGDTVILVATYTGRVHVVTDNDVLMDGERYDAHGHTARETDTVPEDVRRWCKQCTAYIRAYFT